MRTLIFFGGHLLFQETSMQVGVKYKSEGHRSSGAGVYLGGKNDKKIRTNQSFVGSIIFNC